jgi:hypothetical protein
MDSMEFQVSPWSLAKGTCSDVGFWNHFESLHLFCGSWAACLGSLSFSSLPIMAGTVRVGIVFSAAIVFSSVS